MRDSTTIFTSSSSHHCGGKSSSSTPPSSSTKKKNKRYYWQHVIHVYEKTIFLSCSPMHWDKLLATTNAHCSTYLASISISETLLKTPLHKQTWRSQHVCFNQQRFIKVLLYSLLFPDDLRFMMNNEQELRMVEAFDTIVLIYVNTIV